MSVIQLTSAVCKIDVILNNVIVIPNVLLRCRGLVPYVRSLKYTFKLKTNVTYTTVIGTFGLSLCSNHFLSAADVVIRNYGPCVCFDCAGTCTCIK